MALRWADLDLPNGVLTIADTRHSGQADRLNAVRTTKGRRTRRLPIHTSLAEILNKLPRAKDGRVFTSAQGAGLRADHIRIALVRDVIEPLKNCFPTAASDIGFEHGWLHSFRHYFVSQAFICGASEGDIRSWVGHRDSRMIERYRHFRPSESKRKMAQMEFLSSSPPAASDGVAGEGEGI